MKIVNIYLDTVDSTNTYVKERRKTFRQDQLTCVLAESQTAGRGQFGRVWISPRGVNLYITFFFTLPKNTPWISQLATLLAKSVQEVLAQMGINAQFKLPNDLLINGKKMAGVLCEVIFEPDAIEVILGLGLNVNMEKEDLKNIDQSATSLKVETNCSWDKFYLLKEIQQQFLTNLKEQLKKTNP